MWSGCLWDLTGLVALQPTGQSHGLWKQGQEVWSSWPCPQRPLSVVGHKVHGLIQEKDKSNNAGYILHSKKQNTKVSCQG